MVTLSYFLQVFKYRLCYPNYSNKQLFCIKLYVANLKW